MMGHMFGNSYTGDWDSMPDYMKQMMQNYYGGSSFFWQFAGILEFVTRLLVIILLVALIRWVWKKGNSR